MDPKLADRLAAMRDIGRPFHFCFEGSLLRRGETRTARSRRRRREADLQTEMRAELRECERRAFRGPVSVNISLHGRRTNAAASVKAYLDCMEGIFYADDRAVEHLYVQAFSGASDDVAGKAYLEIEPVGMYTTNFEHAYSRLGGGFGRERNLEVQAEFERDQLESLEEELTEEQRRGSGLFDDFDPELAEQIRKDRLKEISRLRFRMLVARELDLNDRPGLARSSARTQPDETDQGCAQKELPGSVWLPLPGVSGWENHVERALAGHMTRWGIERVPINFLLGLGLDLAVQGSRNSGKDLDNLAHVVTAGFRRVAGLDPEDPVTSYRVYARPGDRDGVRVRLVDARLLEGVHNEVFESRYRRLRAADD